MNPVLVETTHGLALSGDLNFKTVVKLAGALLPYQTRWPVLKVDLSAVTTVNSAAIALLLEWKRSVLPKPVEFLNVPLQLQKLIDVCDVQSILIGANDA